MVNSPEWEVKYLRKINSQDRGNVSAILVALTFVQQSLFWQLEMLQRLGSPGIFQSLVTLSCPSLSSFSHNKNDSTLFGISGKRMELNWHEKKHLNTDSRKMEKNSISLLMSQPRRTVDTTLWRPMVGYQLLNWLCKVGTIFQNQRSWKMRAGWR